MRARSLNKNNYTKHKNLAVENNNVTLVSMGHEKSFRQLEKKNVYTRQLKTRNRRSRRLANAV